MDIEKAVGNFFARSGYERVDLKCALFDMDGVLFNSMPGHARAWHEVMTHHGFVFPAAEAYMQEGRTGADTIDLVMRRELGRPATEAEMRDIYKEKSDLFNSYPPAAPMEGAAEVVRLLRRSGLRATIVTGSGQRSLLEKVERCYGGLFELDKSVTAFDVRRGKPSPEPYLMGLAKMGVQANEAIVVENAPLGVQAGHAAGVFTIAVNTGPLADEVLLEHGADVVFGNMKELAEAWPDLRACLAVSAIHNNSV